MRANRGAPERAGRASPGASASVPQPRSPSPAASEAAGPRLAAVAVAVWVVLVAVAYGWGRLLLAAGEDLRLDLPPLFAALRPHAGVLLLPALALAAAAVTLGPALAARLRWRWLLAIAMGTSIAWAAALALTDGPRALVAPLIGPHDYLAGVSLFGGPSGLAGFAEQLARYPIHVRGHPPGVLLALWGLRVVGLGHPSLLAGLVLVLWGSTVPAVLLAVREFGGEERARAGAPFLALAPAAIWAATSMDAVFAAAGAWGVALVVLAIARRGPRSDALAAGGGLVFGAGLFLTYGLPPLLAVALTAGAARRRIRPLLIAGGAGLLVAAAFLAAGFSWFEGLRATVRQYAAGVGGKRPPSYFLLANLAAFAIALGPAAAAAFARLRHRGMWLLTGGALAAVALADLSGLSRGEVERIWLPFVPWVLAACASLGRPPRPSRGWLAAQLATALVLEVLVMTPW
ncbi:MAG: hypothetical protein ACRDJ4_11385 [Actinomycetota bacterium]